MAFDDLRAILAVIWLFATMKLFDYETGRIKARKYFLSLCVITALFITSMLILQIIKLFLVIP